MRALFLVSSALAIASTSAIADLIEIRADGVISVQSSPYFNPDTGPDRQGTAWDLSIIFDTDHLWDGDSTMSSIRSATIRVGEQSYTANLADQPSYAGGFYGNQRDDMHHDSMAWTDGVGFAFNFGDGLVLKLGMVAFPDWWAHPVGDPAASWSSQSYAEFFPTDFNLSDFQLVDFGIGFNGDSTARIPFPFPDMLDMGPIINPNIQWEMEVHNLTGRLIERVVPVPSTLLAFGALGLTATRRRR